jgi:hypothetical protein
MKSQAPALGRLFGAGIFLTGFSEVPVLEGMWRCLLSWANVYSPN